jgi:hypothetical protein
MDKKKTYFAIAPVFPFLLCLFFVFHGYVLNFNYIPPGDAALLVSVYLVASILLTGLCWLLFRNFYKAALMSFSLLCLYFFFGSFHDFLKKYFHDSLPTRYVFLLPTLFALFILLAIFLYRRKRNFFTVTRYLNILLLVFLTIDIISLLGKTVIRKTARAIPNDFAVCDSCKKPDIYLILADEYAGSKELKDLFGFDNSGFENALKERGFNIVNNSYSNYNYTPFSVASILNMDYLSLPDTARSGNEILYSYERIRYNKLHRDLRSAGYTFYNYSIFDFDGQPARTQETFLPAKLRLITSQTFFSRLRRDIGFNLITRFHSRSALRAETYGTNENNQHLYDLTWKITEEKTSTPKFIYTHLMMPHYPYYYDENGREHGFEELVEGNQVNKGNYISYLKYSNKKFLALIDKIKKQAPGPPVIVLIGDHGFRHFTEPVERQYYFLNLNAVYFPDGNYKGLRDSVSMVNEFRMILNNRFQQGMPLLKDSTIYLKDD